MTLLITSLFVVLVHLVHTVEIKVVRVGSNNNPQEQRYQQQSGYEQPNQLQQEQADLVKSDTHYQTEGVPSVTVVRPLQEKDVAAALQADPLLATLILSYNLHINPGPTGFNHPQHLPVNPYVSLLLSHYGRYIPTQGHPSGIYGYAAANNYHNNLPFGAYKIYEDVDV